MTIISSLSLDVLHLNIAKEIRNIISHFLSTKINFPIFLYANKKGAQLFLFISSIRRKQRDYIASINNCAILNISIYFLFLHDDSGRI